MTLESKERLGQVCYCVMEHTHIRSLADCAVGCVNVTDLKGWELSGQFRTWRGIGKERGWVSVGCVVVRLRTGQPRDCNSIRGRGNRWSSSVAYPASYSVVMSSFFSWVKRTGREAHFHLVLRL
jgi:hypothetical protein